MAASNDDAGNLRTDQELTPCGYQQTQGFIHLHSPNSKASSDNDVVPSTVPFHPPHKDKNYEEVPSSFLLHHPSDNMDLNGEDEGDTSYKDAEVPTR